MFQEVKLLTFRLVLFRQPPALLEALQDMCAEQCSWCPGTGAGCWNKITSSLSLCGYFLDVGIHGLVSLAQQL